MHEVKYLYSLPKYGHLIKRKILIFFSSEIIVVKNMVVFSQNLLCLANLNVTLCLIRNEKQFLLFTVLENRYFVD